MCRKHSIILAGYGKKNIVLLLEIRNFSKIPSLNLEVLINSGVVRANTKDVKIIASGEIKRAVTIRGIPVTAGARKAIEEAKGKVEA